MARRLWMIDADGGEPEQLTDDPGYRDERPLWSADGSHLLFARFDAENRASLWLISLETGEPQRMMDVIADEELQRVAVVSHAGPINVMLRQFLGGGVVRLRTCWFELDWASTSCLRSTPEGKWVRWVNDARHIDALRHRLSFDGDDAS